jgi:hypothetical protein
MSFFVKKGCFLENFSLKGAQISSNPTIFTKKWRYFVNNGYLLENCPVLENFRKGEGVVFGNVACTPFYLRNSQKRGLFLVKMPNGTG